MRRPPVVKRWLWARLVVPCCTVLAVTLAATTTTTTTTMLMMMAATTAASASEAVHHQREVDVNGQLLSPPLLPGECVVGTDSSDDASSSSCLAAAAATAATGPSTDQEPLPYDEEVRSRTTSTTHPLLSRRNGAQEDLKFGSDDDDDDEEYHDEDDDDEHDHEEEELFHSDDEEVERLLDESEVTGVRQRIEDENDLRFSNKLASDIAYYHEFVDDEKFRYLGHKCQNRHALCTEWSLQMDGTECDNNFRFMKRECPVACHSCDWLDVKSRCAPDPNETDALQPGDLDKLFERIVTDPELVEQFQPKVLSRPTYADGDNAETATYKIGLWLVLLPNFLTSHEANQMVDVVERSNLAPSKGLTETGTGNAISEVSDARTSWNSFCENDCHNDPAHQRMLSRAELLLGLPQRNFEDTQLLRYYPGQYYMRHHDFIKGHLHDPMGPRILTLFAYLSDVTAGGGTDFPELNVTVRPLKGAAVLWPSVFSESPTTEDPRADHEALPVLEGVKYGANIWVHQRDFKAAFAKDCVETTTTVA